VISSYFTFVGRTLFGVCFAAEKHVHLNTDAPSDAPSTLHDVWDSDFAFWCASAAEQSSWVQVRG
jgi:hypothetical protein